MKYNYKYYNKIAHSYNFTRKFFLFGRNKLINKIININNINSITEIGCGTGYILHKINKLNSNFNLSGIDLSDGMLKIAKKNNSEINFIQEDIFKLNKIDSELIIMSYFLTLFEDTESLLKHLYSIINKNSKIIILDFHSFDNYFYRIFMRKEGVKSIQDIEEAMNEYFKLEEVNTYKSPYLLWKYSISIYSKK